MTIHKKGTGTKAKNEVATSSSSSGVTTMETVEVVSSTSVVEESRRITESESRSSAVEVTSTSREITLDSKGNVIEVIKTQPTQIVGQHGSFTQRTGKSSQDFIAGEQLQSIKQSKTTHEDSSRDILSSSENRTLQGETSERTKHSVEKPTQQIDSHTVQQSISSETLTEASSSSERHSGRQSSVTLSQNVRNEERIPVVQMTTSKSIENTSASREKSDATTRNGQTLSSTTTIRETEEKINDNGKTTFSSSREIDSERTVNPSTADTQSNLKSEKANIDVSARCNKPGQSTWDGTFVYEKKPVILNGKSTPESGKTIRDGKNTVDKTVTLKSHDDRQENGKHVKITEKSTTEEMSVTDQTLSLSSAKTIIDQGQLSTTTRLHHGSGTDMTDFSAKQIHIEAERHPKEATRHSKPGDSTWDGSFVIEKTTESRQRNDTDTNVLHHRHGDNVVEGTRRSDEKETSSRSMHTVKGSSDSTKFITEERRDVREGRLIDIHDSSSNKEERDVRVSSSSYRKIMKPGDSAWNGEFIYEKTPDDVKKRPINPTVVRRTEKHHDSVDVQDVSEEQNISNITEAISTSYIVEYATSDDRKNMEKITSVSEAIPEEDTSSGTGTPRHSASPDRQNKRDTTTSRCYKPGQSAWDGTFTYEQPKTSDARRRKPADKRTVRTVDIRDVTEDNSINEADITSSSYIVEHSSSQQTSSDIRDASLSSMTYETVMYKEHPIERITKVGEDISRSKISMTQRQTGPPSERPGSPKKEKGKDKDLQSTKLGSSTWDGSFLQKKSEKKQSSSGKSIDRKSPDKTDSKKVFLSTTKDKEPKSPETRKRIDAISTALRDIVQDTSSTSEIIASSMIMEESSTHESYRDSSNLDFSTTSVETFITRDGQPVTSTPRRRTSQEHPHSPLKKQSDDVITITDVKDSTVKSPMEKPLMDDRSYRPTKPGSSTWDGSFVHEKRDERKSDDRKLSKETAIDKLSPITEKSIIDRGKSVAMLDTSSKDITSSVDYSTSSMTFERTLVADTKTHDSSNISKTLIHESTDDKLYAIDYEKSKRPSDEGLKSSPQKPQIDDKESPEKSRKSLLDRMERPSKPGASTWDGSFVYEKPQDSQKKPTTTTDESIEMAKKSTDTRKSIKKDKEVVHERKIPAGISSPRHQDTKDDKRSQQDITIIKCIEDTTDVTQTAEIVQKSSYVIDQSSSFTSVQDVRDVTDKHVITQFTTDTQKDTKDVSESTKKFIDKEQVTSMVAHDVVDDNRFDAITTQVSRSPVDSTRRPSPEKPGYPYGIPGLREDDRPKSRETVGKPSRPRGRSPQQTVEYEKSYEIRSKSPEKHRDYTSPTRKPMAGKPSRQTVQKSMTPGKSERMEERPESPKKPVETEKPKRGDQSPDSLDEDGVRSGPVPIPDILSKIPLKEQCICELCTCGRHRCPHNWPEEHLEVLHDEPVHTITSYRQEFDEKRLEKQMRYHYEDQLRTEGEFIGERRTDYIATKGERMPIRKPQDNLKPEGEFVKRPKEQAPKKGERASVKKPQDNLKFEGDFDTTTTTELVFTGVAGERPSPIRRNTYTKIEGDFTDETTTRSQYIDHRSMQRAEIIKRTDNLTVGEGEFTGTSRVKEDFQTYVIEREPQWRPLFSQEHDRFYSKTDVIDSTTTSQEQYRTFDQADYKSSTVIRRADNLKPEGFFEALPHTKDEYIAPILSRRPEPQIPRDNLRPEGPFVGKPKDDYRPTRGERADVKRPQDNLRPEGLFEGRPKDDYSPKRGERPEVKRPGDNLRPEGVFIARPKDDYRPTRGERADVKKPRDNLMPEGSFDARPKDDFLPKIAERPEVKRPKDNLRPEGNFESPSKDRYIPGEKRTPIRYPDNLYLEGDFERPELIPYGPGDRASIVRHPDNLFPRGEFPDRELAPFTAAERRTPIKYSDNLRPEGDFTGKPKDDYKPTRGERADVKKPEDNLKPEGPFVIQPKNDYSPKKAERPEVKKPRDNLKSEGRFEGRPKDDYLPKRAERPEVKRPEDNLRPEGPFEVRPKDDFSPKRGERPDVKKPVDNLRSEGDFERPEKTSVGPAEKRTPIKHPDNLKPEGDFERPEQKGYRPAERPEVKKPLDNLKPEGEFERPQPGKYTPAEKRTPVKYADNLKPEGEFIARPKEDFIPVRGDRADVKKPQDNLRPEGPFEGRPKDDYQPVRGERMDVVKRIDNLRMEGDIETYRSRDEYADFLIRERSEVTKYQDNLRMEGEFIDMRTRDDFKVVKGERMDIIKHHDNLRPEGLFEARPKDDYLPKRAERPEVKKPEDNLKPEGDFVRQPKEDAPKKGERADVKKPKDNLRPEGDFERPEKKPMAPAERRTPIKHGDNLKPEGEFERPKPKEFKPAERPVVKKPHDNLKPEGEFVSRPKEEAPKKGDRADIRKPKDNLRSEGDFERPEKKPMGPAERRTPIKHGDNLKSEGEFERPKPAEFMPAERPVVKKPHDNLKPEGEFVSRPKEEAPKKGDRADVRKPKDNLRSEGDFERPEKKPMGPAERRTPIKHGDNLKPEGEFERPKPAEFMPAERPVVKIPQDNLKPEGEFISRPKEEAPKKGDRADVRKPQDNLRSEGEFERPEKKPMGPAERRTPIKHGDNLKPEGEFERPKPAEFKPAERPVVKKPHDNLKPEGEFISRPKEEAPKKGDRADIRKPQDNLRSEGEFERPEKKPMGPAERRSPIKHGDNLKPEGDFVRRPKEYAPQRGERADIKKPQDNLRSEGDFERPEKKPIVPAERRTPIKHMDNLKSEGEFIGKPKEVAPKRGDRADIKIPVDNLKPEGDFVRPEKSPIGPTEKRTPIKHPDNLRPEGEFVKRPKTEIPLKGDRADVTKPKDNLQPEGEFERPKKSPVRPAERRKPIRHEDNLYPEGEFVGQPKDDFVPKRADRPVQKKPKDNLKPEGEFVGKPKDDYKPAKGERTEIVIHPDNLKMEGDIAVYRSRDDYMTSSKLERVDVVHHEDNLKIEGEFVDIHRRDDYRVTRGERSDIIRHEDNLRSEGEFERPEKTPVSPAERRSPIKHPDNLKPEGDFVHRLKEPAPIKGERASVKKPKDNLKSEGEFERPTKSPTGPGERRSPIKHPDNLYPEGEFVRRPRKDTPLKGDRADVRKPKDNLHPEGEFAKRSPKKVEPAERRSPIKHEDNLYPEGAFYIIPKDDFVPKRGDRAPIKKPLDNLRPEGEMEVSPSSKDDYKKYVNGERMEIRRHEDNLHMEGEMNVHRSRDDYKKITKMEKVDVKKHEDNLRMEGEFIDVCRKNDYTYVIGERVPVKKHPDNLRPEGDINIPKKIVLGPGERRSPIKHPDNLKPEGDFERRTPTKIGPGERRSPIRHIDNLKPEGAFIGRPRDDFVPKRAERAEVVKREDNLKMTGDFQGTTSHNTTYTIVRGERADIKCHEDNLKLSSDAMEMKTTTADTFTPTKKQISPIDKTVNRRRHMESSITLGDDIATTSQRNYNTYTKRTGKDIAEKMSKMESEIRKSTESQTLADKTVVTTVRQTTASTQADQRTAQTVTHQQQAQQHIIDRGDIQSAKLSSPSPYAIDTSRSSMSNNQYYINEQHQRMRSNEQHFRSHNQMQSNRRTIDDRSITEIPSHRGQIIRENTSRYETDAAYGEHHKQHHQHLERHNQELSKRDYVNAQRVESRQNIMRSSTKQHEQHTLSNQGRYNSMQLSSPEYHQVVNGHTSMRQSQIDSAAKINHHRKNVISSSSVDVNNAVLHRRGNATSTEALHTISSTAADQRKSLSNLAESGQYISNSSQSSDRKSLTSMHRSTKDVNPWAASSYERPQRIVRQDNLTVGGKFYSQSEAKNYGNFSSTQRMERVQKQTNASHINLGDGTIVSSSMYKREYIPRQRGPCPATLLEAKQAPFKHTRDTQKHKFYMPVISG